MGRQNVFQHEMTDFSDQTVGTGLLDADSAKLKRATRSKRSSKFQDFLKHAGLQLPDALMDCGFAKKSSKEHPKVAIYQSRRMAILNSLPHMVAVCSAVALLVLFWTKHWVGTSDSATTLQFVAKLHELFMQASSVDILLYIIRAQALNGRIPLGALSGAVKGPQLSYLWSLDFASAISSPAFNIRRKITFVLSALGLLFLSAVVGPSSAVLMIPRPDMLHVSNTTIHHIDLPEVALYPTEIDQSHELNFTNAPNSHLSTIALQILPARGNRMITRLADTPGFDITKPVLVRSVSSPENDTAEMYTIATIPTSLSYSLLGQPVPAMVEPSAVNYFTVVTTGGAWTLRSWQPLVTMACVSTRPNEVSYYYKDDGSKESLPNITNFYEQSLKNNEVRDHSLFLNGTWLWIVSPEEGSSSLLSLYFSDTVAPDSPIPFHQACSIASFWWNTETRVSATDAGFLIQNNVPMDRKSVTEQQLKPISIKPDVLDSMYRIGGMWGGDGTPYYFGATAQAPLQVALSLSQLPWASEHTEWLGSNNTSRVDPKDSTTFQIKQTLRGYGYGVDHTSVRLSVAVITAYCLIATIYVAYLIVTGHTSIAWDSATEMILLALQSKEPNNLGHTSVGLNSMETFRRNVSIRVKNVNIGDTGETREKLELVFANDNQETEQLGFSKVVRNKAY
ncbi:hypothetical protein IQ07DRAFT_638863 [Pyrenochaeta sp. DS3sAY3a]|nr:hypothetical protein IQ07DRAFT_638863 [Pyrenochaeta sp. DS3sAY3a]